MMNVWHVWGPDLSSSAQRGLEHQWIAMCACWRPSQKRKVREQKLRAEMADMLGLRTFVPNGPQKWHKPVFHVFSRFGA